MRPHPDRRRWNLIDRKFQYGFAIRLVVSMVLLFALGLVLVFLPSIFLLITSGDQEVLEKAAAEFLVLHKRIWPAAIFCFAGAFAYCLFLSRRIAGPIYRVNVVLEQLLKGERPERVTFRKNDWFQPTSELLKQLSEKLNGPPQQDGGTAGGGSR